MFRKCEKEQFGPKLAAVAEEGPCAWMMIEGDLCTLSLFVFVTSSVMLAQYNRSKIVVRRDGVFSSLGRRHFHELISSLPRETVEA